MTNLQLLLIDGDPIFRLGLRAACAQYSDLQVVAEVETGADDFDVLGAIAALGEANIPNLVIWDLDAQILPSGATGGQDVHPTRKFTPCGTGILPVMDIGARFELNLTLCQQLKTQYPNLPVLLLGTLLAPAILTAARQAGATGYCAKGTAVAEIVAAIRQVASGESYWPGSSQEQNNTGNAPLQDDFAFPRRRKLLANISLSGVRQIDAAIAQVSTQLQASKLLQTEDFASLIDWVFLSGRRRELLAARWILSQLLPVSEEQNITGDREQISRLVTKAQLPIPNFTPTISTSQLSPQSSTTSALQAALFDTAAAKLQSNLVNLTGQPLEIDIFRLTKKRELIYVILRKLQDLLNELRFSQVQLQQLSEKRSTIIRDLWQSAIADFFGKYYTLRIDTANVAADSQLPLKKEATIKENSTFVLPTSSLLFSEGQERIEVVPVLLQDADFVESTILDKIPLVVEFFSHLLFQTPLIIDNTACEAGSPEAMVRSQAMLENLAIQIANGVVQPLLNNFADLEEIKQKFYDRQLISTREIERFRNNLSWKYRIGKLFGEPQEIFESRFLLLVLNEQGIQKLSIYAPRNQELAQLSGVQLAVTLVLETRDAIAPRLRSIVAFFGTGVVYVLTQVIGRGIGLIGRGIIQGIGNYLQDSKLEKKGD